MNPHREDNGYNGVECERSDPSASLRHFYGTDVKRAILESGHFNGRSRDLELIHVIVDSAVTTFGPVREVYLRDRDREVTASFGDQIRNRLWISSGKVGSIGQVHASQYLDRPDENVWRTDLTDAPRRDSPRQPSPAITQTCLECNLRLPLAAAESCPNCGADLGGRE